MTTELTNAAQQALEALRANAIHYGDPLRCSRDAIAALERALTQRPAAQDTVVRVCPFKDAECGDRPASWCDTCPKRPAAQTDSMGMPKSCGKPLCSPDEHHPLCKLHKPVERPAAQEVDWRCPACGTHEVAVKLECHNSACRSYASAVTVHEGWKAPQQATPELVGEVVAWRATYEGLTFHAASRDGLAQALAVTMHITDGVTFEPLYTRPAATPAVPEDSAQEAMTSKWCWWFGDGERFQIVDTESEAHGEAQSYIDDDADSGEERAYSIARVQHPIDALGMDWLALHVAESIAENVCCWCDDNTGAEEPSIMLSPDDSKALGLMVATFLRQRVGVDWWTADQKTVTQHTYVAGSNDALAAAQAKGADHG